MFGRKVDYEIRNVTVKDFMKNEIPLKHTYDFTFDKRVEYNPDQIDKELTTFYRTIASKLPEKFHFKYTDGFLANMTSSLKSLIEEEEKKEKEIKKMKKPVSCVIFVGYNVLGFGAGGAVQVITENEQWFDTITTVAFIGGTISALLAYRKMHNIEKSHRNMKDNYERMQREITAARHR